MHSVVESHVLCTSDAPQRHELLWVRRGEDSMDINLEPSLLPLVEWSGVDVGFLLVELPPVVYTAQQELEVLALPFAGGVGHLVNGNTGFRAQVLVVTQVGLSNVERELRHLVE